MAPFSSSLHFAAACGLLALVRLSAAQLVVNEFASGDNVALGSTYGNDWFEIFNNGKTLSADFAGLGYGGITYENSW